ncbi:hypothetical protein [Candidatus Hodgkinia cicadicola]
MGVGFTFGSHVLESSYDWLGWEPCSVDFVERYILIALMERW